MPNSISIDAYDYELPKSLIAQQPLERRDDARLMVIDRASGDISHHHVRDLPDILASGDLVVLNDSRVIPAKLVGFRDKTRGRWQGLFLTADSDGNWKVLSKTRGKLEPGETVSLQDREGTARCRLVMLARLDGGAWACRPETGGDPYELLDQVGRVPLPHYIRDGNMVAADVKNYQTIFANKPGSVAAPTAGLHLTKTLIERLIDSQKSITRVTLHVGIGTFRPVTAATLDEHVMHAEWGQVDAKSIEQMNACRARGGRVIAVGTTVTRILEAAARAAPGQPWSGETDLFIQPGFQFQAIDGLLTNFHLPRSTLLVLVRTFGGDELMKRAYQEAIEEKYRFFSYGDAMLIL